MCLTFLKYTFPHVFTSANFLVCFLWRPVILLKFQVCHLLRRSVDILKRTQNSLCFFTVLGSHNALQKTSCTKRDVFYFKQNGLELRKSLIQFAWILISVNIIQISIEEYFSERFCKMLSE